MGQTSSRNDAATLHLVESKRRPLHGKYEATATMRIAPPSGAEGLWRRPLQCEFPSQKDCGCTASINGNHSWRAGTCEYCGADLCEFMAAEKRVRDEEYAKIAVDLQKQADTKLKIKADAKRAEIEAAKAWLMPEHA